jgi:site-specific recombinase XerD
MPSQSKGQGRNDKQVHRGDTIRMIVKEGLPAARRGHRRNASRSLTLLTTHSGKPFSAAGFGYWFRDRCNEAGLRHCSAHGLRKAAARRLAEAGCTTHEIAAITGHTSLSEVQRYTKAADQKRLALAAMEKAK